MTKYPSPSPPSLHNFFLQSLPSIPFLGKRSSLIFIMYRFHPFFLSLSRFFSLSIPAVDLLFNLPQLLVVLLKRGLIRSYHTKSSKVQEEKHIPTLHIERINGTEKLTMEWSWLFRCHLGVAQSYSKIFRGICHEPCVDSWGSFQIVWVVPSSYCPH
jgi:hypothetical protein